MKFVEQLLVNPPILTTFFSHFSTAIERPVRSGVPQGRVCGRILYLMYTADFSQFAKTTIAIWHKDPVQLTHPITYIKD